MRRVNPTVLAAAAIGLLVLIAAVLILTRQGRRDQDKLSDDQAAGNSTGPEKRCASQRTYDRIKSEIFRQAAEVRKSDRAAFDRLASYASVRVDGPLLRSHDAELGTVRCTGRLSIDLPPGVAVVGGRRSLSADVDYVLQPAADGSGDVVILEGADPIIVPLATLARTGETAPTPAVPVQPGGQPSASTPVGPVPSAPPTASEPAPRASASCHSRRQAKLQLPLCPDARRDRGLPRFRPGRIRSPDGRAIFPGIGRGRRPPAGDAHLDTRFLPPLPRPLPERFLHRRNLSRAHAGNPRHHERRLAALVRGGTL
jgi:hypothetical protein